MQKTHALGTTSGSPPRHGGLLQFFGHREVLWLAAAGAEEVADREVDEGLVLFLKGNRGRHEGFQTWGCTPNHALIMDEHG